MLFDIGWPELMLIGIVALVVIGPKDLPRALRVAGFWVRKARTLSREFQSSIDQMIREAELEEVRIIWSDRKSTRLNSSHRCISYAVFCLKKKTKNHNEVQNDKGQPL